MAEQAGHATRPGHVRSPRAMYGRPASGAVRVDAVAGRGVGLTGQISAAILRHVRGGQPLLLRRGRKVAAVLLDPDTYAELEAMADDLLAMEASAWPGQP